MKAELRARAYRSSDPQAAEAVARHVLAEVALPPVIAGVWPLPGELDLRPLLLALHGRGHRVVLPRTTKRGERLVFHRWVPGTAMVAGRFGTAHPQGEVEEPDMVLVPLLAFDRRGNRLGYGGGYYDRTLAALPGRLAVGFGFAAQEVDAVPTEAHDVALDAVVTEREVIWVGGRTC